MLPKDRLVCAFVEPQTVGLQFTQWLLHVTVVPWFRIGETTEVIRGGLQRALSAIKPFSVTVEGEAMFGPRKNRPVKLLRSPNGFEAIEPKVRNYLHKKSALLIDETTKRKTPFRAHITLQPGASIADGDVVTCNRLYIVEQKGDYKEIVGEISLG
jgi:2'-5' RNA ligase